MMVKRPAPSSLPTTFVKRFRKELQAGLSRLHPETGKSLANCIGVYVFYDYDGEPIYVGQTREKLSARIGRHLTGQRSDTVAYRILDPFEVAEVEVFPTEGLRTTSNASKDEKRTAQRQLDAVEYNVYIKCIQDSKYNAILNEKIPPRSAALEIPEGFRFSVIPDDIREDREHPDVRIARRAETLARLAAVAHERGEITIGMRRVIVIQALRLADLGAARMAEAEGRPRPSIDAINIPALVGSLLEEAVDQKDASGVEDGDVVE